MSVQTSPLFEAKGLTKHFPILRGLLQRPVGAVRAVDGISLSLAPGECLGVVGESGSGKSTLGRILLRLIEPTEGQIQFDGTDVRALSNTELRAFRKNVQMIFQDPFSSLNPRMKVGACLAEVMRLHEVCPPAEIETRVGELLSRVGLSPDHGDRYPSAFSGGQRQRIAIARALAAGPRFIVADEAVSALDVSIQAEVIKLLDDLRGDLGLAMLFISHDLSVVEVIADRVMVMYLGQVMETGETRDLFEAPAHPYTYALLSAVPSRSRKKERIPLKGEIPSPSNPPSGCVFRTRCPHAIEACAEKVPELREVKPGHWKACIRDGLDIGVPK